MKCSGKQAFILAAVMGSLLILDTAMAREMRSVADRRQRPGQGLWSSPSSSRSTQSTQGWSLFSRNSRSTSPRTYVVRPSAPVVRPSATVVRPQPPVVYKSTPQSGVVQKGIAGPSSAGTANSASSAIPVRPQANPNLNTSIRGVPQQ